MEPSAIIAEIERLDNYDREQFNSLLAELKDSRLDKRNLARRSQYVADAISEICRQHLTVARWRALKIDTRAAELFAWLGDQTADLNETQTKGLVLVCVKAVAAQLRYKKQRVDLAGLLDGLDEIGVAMERAYPNYWESRLLHMLVQREEVAA
jgi:hypothetical protein